MATMEFYIDSVREMLASRNTPMLADVCSFGCQLNFSEGEKIKGLLAKMGFGFTDSEEAAQLIILNTCAVRETAEERVFGRIGALKHYKEKNPDVIIGLAGCMTAESHVVEKIRKSYPFVDLVCGTSALDKLPKLIYDILNGTRHAFDTNEYGDIIFEGAEQLRDSRYKASVPIMYGCNNFCTYCIVPYVRGRERSRRPQAIIDEVRSLAARGYKEIMLLGQNVNSYGRELTDGMSFPQLLRKLNEIDGDFIIRFMSSHPKDAGRDLIDAILECDKVGKHLHLPVQSGSDSILEAMNRRYTVSQYMEIVDYARSKCSDFSFSTDIIVGFPNESREDFEGTIRLMKRVVYDNIYSFIYSKRSGTSAALIEDRISDEEKGLRMRELLEVQRELATEANKRFIGRTMRVLADGKSKHDGFLTGKSSEFVIVEFEAPEEIIGSFVNVKITESRNWAVKGNII